ncbi:DUF5053 domain-containing protein [Phocaeicola sartorii]|uniref:DUF5053 domain-containing protein n=1 Tax=Phocaeicola sartorii TaxID=671267 RepID=UPI002557DC38|nr:DUF5053 domain-containing protein [Phocaeicola sartorii]
MEKAKKNILEMGKDEIRSSIVSYKMGAVDNMVLELNTDGIVDFGKFCEKYLQRTKDWTAGRLEACINLKKDEAFTPEEYTAISAGLRDLAARLAVYADEIDSAKDE